MQNTNPSGETKCVDLADLLVARIIFIRNNSSKMITRLLRSFFYKTQEKIRILTQIILKERNIIAKLIQRYYKMSVIRKTVSRILKMEADNFRIESSIRNVRKVQLKVISKNDKELIYDFTFLPILQKFILYIPRYKVLGARYLVNFIADDKIVIDSAFQAEYDTQGNYYNVIDFNKIEQIEKERFEDKMRLLRYIKNQMHKVNEMKEAYVSAMRSGMDEQEQNLEEYSDKYFSSSSDEEEKTKLKYSSNSRRNSAIFSKKHRTSNMTCLKFNRSLINFIVNPKSILKNKMNSTVGLPKKVSFGNIQYSY